MEPLWAFTRDKEVISDGFTYADIRWLVTINLYWFEIGFWRINR